MVRPGPFVSLLHERSPVVLAGRYREHLMREVLVEPVEAEVTAIRQGFLTGLGLPGVAVLHRYSVTCDDLIDMVG